MSMVVELDIRINQTLEFPAFKKIAMIYQMPIGVMKDIASVALLAVCTKILRIRTRNVLIKILMQLVLAAFTLVCTLTRNALDIK